MAKLDGTENGRVTVDGFTLPERATRAVGWLLVMVSVFFAPDGESRFYLLGGIGVLLIYEPSAAAALLYLGAVAIFGIARPYDLHTGHTHRGHLDRLLWIGVILFGLGLLMTVVHRALEDRRARPRWWQPRSSLLDLLLAMATLTLGMWWMHSPDVRIEAYRQCGLHKRAVRVIRDTRLYPSLADFSAAYLPPHHPGHDWLRRLVAGSATPQAMLTYLRVAHEMRAASRDEVLATLAAHQRIGGDRRIALALFSLVFESVDGDTPFWYPVLVTTDLGLPLLLPPSHRLHYPHWDIDAWIPEIADRWRLAPQVPFELPDDPIAACHRYFDTLAYSDLQQRMLHSHTVGAISTLRGDFEFQARSLLAEMPLPTSSMDVEQHWDPGTLRYVWGRRR